MEVLVRAHGRVRHKKSATAGNYSVFKAYHVERNRLYCLWKWMPRFLVFVSPLFTLNRYAMQGYAVLHAAGRIVGIREGIFDGAALRAADSGPARRAVASAANALETIAGFAKCARSASARVVRLISRFKLDAIELALKS